MVGVTKIQRGNAGYWLAAVQQGKEDYYTKPGEAPGEWIGALAAELELSGQVDAEGYGAILEGTDPTSGDQLVRRPDTRFRDRPDGTQKRVEPVLGYDVRFSCPKSVSIVYALGDEDTRTRVLSVVNDAVREGLAHLENEACYVQRGKGGHHLERGEGFVGMAFRHRMSRSGDPALHVHVVISNLTRAMSDGKWLSLASPQGQSPLFPHGKSAGVVFQAALRAGFLREFGLEFDAVTNGYADLKGFTRDVIEALSTRSREIAEWTEKHGVDTIAAKQIAAYRTRDKKDYGVDEDDRRGEWEQTAEPFGVTPESVGQMVADAQPREPHQLADADLGAALAKLEESNSHFDRRALLWAIADQLPEGADSPTLSVAVDQVLASDRTICLYSSDEPLDFDYYTTPHIAELERHFIQGALDGADAGIAEVAPATLAAVLERHSYLSADQREMVVRLTTSGEQVVPVAAWPGTGKTTSLKAAKESWDAAGFPVVGCATARTASGELIDAGISNATSIRALLNRTDALREEGIMPLPRGTVIIVDEASTTSTPDLAALRFLAVECEGKLVVIGDPKQIGAVGPGGLYGWLTRAVKATTLTIIHRQRREEDRELIALIYEGRGSEALDLLRTRGKLIVADDLPAALDGMLADWHRDFATGADAVMIARRNYDVDDLNHQARELRREEGALGAAEVIVGERAFAVGDRVQTRINRDGVTNRERWDVTATDAAARTITLRRVGGDERTVTLGPACLDRRTNRGGPALEYAYAVTKFGSQGKTVDRAYPLLDSGASLEQELVALSRGREIANVYTVASSELTDPDLGPGRRKLSDELHDIRAAIEREGNEYAAAEVKLRKLIENLSPKALAKRRAELIVDAGAAAPRSSRRDRLELAIKDSEELIGRLAGERQTIEAMKNPPADELARVTTAEATHAEQMRCDLAELARLPESTATAEPKPSLDPAARLEAVLVEATIERNVRREVRAAQLDPTQVIYDTLGPFPANDSDKAFIWGDAAHMIGTYRHRNDIQDESHPLGDHQPRGATARAERARAQRRIEQARRQLGRGADRAVDRAAARAPGIGR